MAENKRGFAKLDAIPEELGHRQDIREVYQTPDENLFIALKNPIEIGWERLRKVTTPEGIAFLGEAATQNEVELQTAA